MFSFVFTCLFCVLLFFGGGCENKEPSVVVDLSDLSTHTPAGQVDKNKLVEEADKLIQEHGTKAILYYFLSEPWKDTDEERILDYVRYLRQQGANINAKNGEGITPLHVVTDTKNFTIAKYLISERADYTAEDNNGQTPFDLAKTKGNKELVELIIRNSLTDAEQVELDKFLAEFGSDIKATDENGETLLHRESLWHVAVVKYLVWHGADVNAKDKYGTTPLHLAHNIEVIKFLVSAGAGVNTKDNDGHTPLYSLVWYDAISSGNDATANSNYIESIKFLVSQGADVNAKDNDGKTPLDRAKQGKNTEVIEYLSSLSAP